MELKLNYKLIGKRIERLRRFNDLTQEMLAERTDLSRVYISYIELGIRKPSLESLIKIGQALNTSIDNILTGNIQPDKNNHQYDFNYLLNDCNNYEKRIIFETVKALKTSFIINRDFKQKM